MKPTRRAVRGQPGLPSLGWSQMVSPCLLAFRLAARRRPCRAFPNGSGRCNSAMNLVDVAERAFDHFEEQRETNLEALRDLPPGSGSRKAVHREVGPITLAQMLNEWALHDLGHIRQIAELVRARKYLAGAGPLGSFYQLKP